MPPLPLIRVEEIEFGRFPVAATLNHRIHPRGTLLRATLAILWQDPSPRGTLGEIERRLMQFSPSFRRHQCRGPRSYHVFSGNGGGGAAPQPAPGDFDAGLALAHLIEHMVIDLECAVTGMSRCSGVTGALRRTPGRYHMFVEAPERGVGRLCLALAMRSIGAMFRGHPPGDEEQEAILSARLAFRNPLRRLTPPGVARAMSWPEPTAGRALALLRDLGYLREEAANVNLSGAPIYRVNGWSPVPAEGFEPPAAAAP